VVGRRSVVGMAPTIIVIRWSTDEGRTQTRVASARVGVLPQVGDGKNEPTRCRMATGQKPLRRGTSLAATPGHRQVVRGRYRRLVPTQAGSVTGGGW
jgi:hypothetical protein